MIAALCVMTSAMYAQNNKVEPYVAVDEMPDGVRFLPAPPSVDSPLFFTDWSLYQWGKTVRNTPRGREAFRDAAYETDSILAIFAPAFGLMVTPTNTPEIYQLVSRALKTTGDPVQKPKKHYQRIRPYVQFNESSLVPKDEEDLRHSGSYPSGHTNRGWALALLLAEISPERQDTIFSRGYQYGQSRVIAGFHYQSDVDAGRVLASAAIARLHADTAFLNQMEKAKKEYARKMKR